MTEHGSPFDDPETKAALEQAGIVHQPGMAKQMMEQLAPMLAEEGVDLNDPDADLDLEKLDAALNYATERYNMELSTPVGADRSRTIATLRQISEAVSGGHTARADRILDAVGPDPTAHRPSNAQLIGTSLDLLDAWHSTEQLQRALSTMSVPGWLGPSRKAARDLLGLARKGRAYASLNQLMINHGGLALAHGGALLAAVTLVKLADDQRTDFSKILDSHLPHEPHPDAGTQGTPSSAAPQGSAFGPAVAAAVSAQKLVKDFSTWLTAEGHDPLSLIEAKIALFQTFVDEASDEGVDPSTPEGFEEMSDMILASSSGSQQEIILALMHDYVHFQLDRGHDPDGWAAAHEDITAETFDDDGPAILMEALRTADAMDEGLRRAALAETRIVAAVPGLLDWLGKSQAITSSGVPRRSDIEPLAAMIGVSAQGVAKRPLDEPSEQDIRLPADQRPRAYVQSALDVPELTAWWLALQAAEVVELTSTRVRPGPATAAFTEAELPPIDQAEVLVSAFVSELLLHEVSSGDAGISGAFDQSLAVQTIAHLMAAAVPGLAVPEPENAGIAHLLQWRVTEKLRSLETAGVVQFSEDEPSIAPALRGPVIRGLMVAADYVSDLEDQ